MMNESNTLTTTIFTGNSNHDIIKDPPTPSVISWTTDDVAKWLASLNLSKFIDKFCTENGIDGLTLLLMKEDDLKQSPLSIKRLCDIKKLWYHIRLLQCKHNDFYSNFDNETAKHNHSSLSPTHLLETNFHNTQCSCHINKEKTVFKTLKGEKRKTFASFIYALIIGIWTSFIMVVVHNRVPNVQKYPPLPDLFLDNIPRISWAFAVSEFLIVVMGTAFLLILMFHKYWIVILRRFFALGGTIFFLRSITMLVTSLSVPGPHLECIPEQYGTTREIFSRWLQIFIFQGLSIHGIRSCGDYMFSGHTVMLTLLNHCITEYTTSDFYVIHLLSWFCNIFGMILILAAHEHYSIDVFIAFFLTSRLFLYYHSLANNAVLHSVSDNRLSIWFPMFSYFEKNIQCMVPNVLRIPWPLSLIYSNTDDQEATNSIAEFNNDKSNRQHIRQSGDILIETNVIMEKKIELSEIMLNSTSTNNSIEYSKILQLSVPLSKTTTTTININSSLTSNPSTWTINQVEEWLKKNNFNDCIDILCHQYKIDGKRLINLKQNEILSLRKNKQLWLQIKTLKPKSTIIQLDSSIINSQNNIISNQIEDQPIINCCFITSIRSDRKKTLLAFLLALMTIFFCSFIITIVDERLPDPKNFPPLPDLILDNLKQITWAFSITEKLILIEMTTLIIVILLHRHRMIILRRLFTITSALYFLRSLTMILTSLPVATKITDCEPKKLINFDARLRKATMIFLGQGLSSFGVKTCGDYLYSGHTCTLVLAAHFINEYTPRSYHLLHFLSWISALTGMFFILAGHQHYSIDILIAWVLSSRLFIYYHTLANNRTFLQRDTNRMRIWFPLFSYFEENVKTAIPNEYCLPSFIYEAQILVMNAAHES
ncbi:unnamed protein product [Rotaria sordida]|uniref:SAM domain-containing protein n=1 Tax=Rotaria sordida TaxID=392033 RepID=A0A818UM56_9BILA|nr:unnamed protein product [Rotaria sordida]